MGGDGWVEYTVEDIKGAGSSALATGPFGSAISAKFFQDHGIPVIRGSNLSQDVGHRLIENGLAFVSQEKAAEFHRSVARPGDLIFTCWGTIDQVGLIDNRCKYPTYIVSNKQMKLTPDPEKADSLFLYYLFSGPEMRATILNQGIGSSVPGFNLGQLRNLRLRLPPLAQQRAIAHILGTLDDKIELNRRMNETLEAMARAIFKSWFVDFDPVRAKMNGRKPEGMDAATAKLFPSGFEESELGPIPRGWQVRTLASYAKLNPESWTKSSAPDQIVYVDLSSAKWGRIETPQQFSRNDAPSRAQRILRVGDTIIGTVRPGNGSYSLISEEGLTGSTGFAVLRPQEPIHNAYVFFAATARDNIDRLSHLADGGAYPAVRPEVVLATVAVHPRECVLEAFSKTVDPLLNRVTSNDREIRTLAETRGALLPRLLSGKIHVSHAERIVEAAI